MRFVTISAAGVFCLAACSSPPAESPKPAPVSSAGSSASTPAAAPASASTAQPPPPPPAAAKEEEGEPITSKARLPEGAQAIGAPAPGFNLDAASSQVGGSAHAVLRTGRVTVVNFFSTTTPACAKQLPYLNELRTKLRAKGVEVMALAEDDELDGILPFVNKLRLAVVIAWDPGHKIGDLYRRDAVPTTYVVDRKGMVRFIHKGYQDGDEKKLEAEVTGLL